MSSYVAYLVLWALTGNPLVALVFLLVGGWVLQHYTLGLFPGPVRFIRRRMRERTLRQQLLQNPHDRRARFELASLLVTRHQYQRALEQLRPNIEAGEHDAETLFLMGIACAGTGHPDQSELFFTQAEEEDARFRLGAIDLERGRWRLARGDAPGAKKALERFLTTRSGSVEGRVLLFRALAKLKDPDAMRMRDQAWQEYASSPRFQQRAERIWAWRARPARPIAYALVLLVAGALLIRAVHPYVNRIRRDFVTSPVALRQNMFEAALEQDVPPENAPSGWKGWRIASLRFATPSRFTMGDEGSAIKAVAYRIPSTDCREMLRTYAQHTATGRVQLHPVRFGGEDGYILAYDLGTGESWETLTTCHRQTLYSVFLRDATHGLASEREQLLTSAQFD